MKYYYISAFLCSFFFALYGIISKRAYSNPQINEGTIIWFVSITNAIFMLPFQFYFFQKPLPDFYLPLFIGIFLNIISFTFLLKGIKLTDVSIVYPLLATTPIFMIFTSPFLLNEKASIYGISGILFISIGVYILSLNFDKNKSFINNLISPFKEIFLNKGAFYTLLVAIIWSFSANIDKYCVIKSNPFVYLFFFHFFYSIIYFPYLIFFTEFKFKNIINKNCFWLLLSISISEFFVGIFQFIAIEKINAAYVVAIKRGGMFFAILAGWLFFKEKNILLKFVGSCFIMAGFIMFVVFK
ncbi:MAG TPA: DMT family transporter [bacterium]|nr:DMT family transporter [bacterium]HOL46847.1 DMT family transporter [bacterium]HPQ18804.1 DMT family transporter [bacterium]